ncbi:MAG: ABC transporter permease [Chitinophagaceae bacterium]
MPQPYNQSKALWAITRASFKAIFAQPTAIVFSLLFPIIFILIFGAFGDRGVGSYRVALDNQSDTSNFLFMALKSHPMIRIQNYKDTSVLNKDLEKGRVTAILTIKQIKDTSNKAHFIIYTKSTSANSNTIFGLKHELDFVKLRFDAKMAENKEEFVRVEEPVITEGRKFRQIDFILPGQLGFSILFSTLFGIAFTFFTLREQLVLKRFYASPVRRIHILLGIGMSRLFFQLINVIVLILFGHFFLNFTLQHGALTVAELILLTIIMLFLLMGVGLIFSSVAKSDASIPLLINLFGFPQMLLSGTFFPITVFPKWLQQICEFLPLTQFNNATRKISFEGLHIFDLWKEIGIMAIWIAIIYIVLSRVIKWE